MFLFLNHDNLLRHDLLVLLMVAQHHHLHDVTIMYTGIYRKYVAAAEEALFPVNCVPWQAASEVHNCESE